jgi:hypothetical protein
LTYHNENIWRGTMPLIDSFVFKFVVLSMDNGKVVFEKWEKDPNRNFSFNEAKNALDSNLNKINDIELSVDNEVLKLKCIWKD